MDHLGDMDFSRIMTNLSRRACAINKAKRFINARPFRHYPTANPFREPQHLMDSSRKFAWSLSSTFHDDDAGFCWNSAVLWLSRTSLFPFIATASSARCFMIAAIWVNVWGYYLRAMMVGTTKKKKFSLRYPHFSRADSNTIEEGYNESEFYFWNETIHSTHGMQNAEYRFIIWTANASVALRLKQVLMHIAVVPTQNVDQFERRRCAE